MESTNFCSYHNVFYEKFQIIEKQIEELKSKLNDVVYKAELNNIQKELEELKKASDQHSNNNIITQQTLARLEEMSKHLKEMMDAYQDQTNKLAEKIDKIYDLILNFQEPQEEHNWLTTVFGNYKITLTIIFLLVAVIIYLLTGHWIVKDNIP